MARFCGNCGAQIQEGEKFCASCGAKVDTSADSADAAADQSAAQQPMPPMVQQPLQQQMMQPPMMQQPRMQPPTGPAPHGPIDRMSFITVLLLTVVTCGIYGIYWMVTFADKVHALVGRQTTASGIKLILYTICSCGIYALYFYAEMGNSLNEAHDQRGMYGHRVSQGVTIILMLFGLGIIPMYQLIQAFNEVVDFDNGQPLQ